MPIKVSVVIPCFNVEEYVEECIRSVLEQTYKHIEIICVDDGSTDGTVSKIKNIQSAGNANIRLIETPNRGAPAARNSGVQYANGGYIQFLDADDILLPDKIGHEIDLIKNSNCFPSFVVGDYIRSYGNGSENIIRADQRSYWYGLLGIRLGITSSNLWSKRALHQVNGWDESLISSQEYDLMFRILQKEPVIIYDRELNTILRHRNNSISQTNFRENRIIAIRLRRQIYDFLELNGLLTDDLNRHYYQFLFTEVRALFGKDRKEALQLYENLFPVGFRLTERKLYEKTYRFLFKVFGFKIAQICWDTYKFYRGKLGLVLRPYIIRK
jgi:glycosyltransferase involved in cell wall biosynthesis